MGFMVLVVGISIWAATLNALPGNANIDQLFNKFFGAGE